MASEGEALMPGERMFVKQLVLKQVQTTATLAYAWERKMCAEARSAVFA